MGKIVAGVVLTVLGVGGFAGVAYAADTAIEADVVEKSCAFSGLNTITAQTRLFGITRVVEVDRNQCTIVPRDAYILYHIRSQRTVIYEKEDGNCIWDTAIGPCGVPVSTPLFTYQ